MILQVDRIVQKPVPSIAGVKIPRSRLHNDLAPEPREAELPLSAREPRPSTVILLATSNCVLKEPRSVTVCPE